jgi:hypothetical protein
MRESMPSVLLRLREELRRSRFSGTVNLDALSSGDPAGFLPLLHFALLGRSHHVASWVTEQGYVLSSTSDERFVTAAHRLLRECFGVLARTRTHSHALALWITL